MVYTSCCMFLVCCTYLIVSVCARQDIWSCNEFTGKGKEAIQGCLVETWSKYYNYISWGAENIGTEFDAEFGQNVLSVFYPNGSCSAHKNDAAKGGKGGVMFKPQPFGADGVDEAGFEYDIKFSKNFDFVIGGKLPGLHGGIGKCSGGHHNTSCFSTRFMWRADGDGEVYAYITNMPSETWFCQKSKGGHCSQSRCNWQYGHSLGRGSIRFVAGQWHRLSQYVKLNDIQSDGTVLDNGYVQVMFDEKQAYRVDGLTFRTSKAMKIDTVSFSTFFGGSKPNSASTDDVYTYYKNFKAYTNDPTDISAAPDCSKY